MGKQETLETIWEVPDELWERVEPIILEEDPPKARGRKRADPRQMLNGIIFRLRSGCQWNRLPKELGGRQHHSSHLSTVGGDGCLAPNVGSPCGGVRRVGWRGLGMAVGRRSDGQGTFWGDLIGPNPTDRGKAGTKRSLLVDGEGGPLSIVVAGANVHDAKLLEADPWTPLWWNDHSPLRRNPNTCVWTKGMTILQAVALPPDTAIGSTSDASVRRSWTPLATSGIRRAGGLWNGRWHGSPSAVRSWSDTTRRSPTTLECYSSHVRSCGSADSGG